MVNPARLAPLLFLTLLANACSTTSDEKIDPARADAAATGQSFRADVIPIMRRWCSNSSCHANKATTLGVEFPIDDPSALYAQLQRESPMAKGAKFVVPGDPSKSFFYAKIEGNQGDPQFKCNPVGCGETMPPGTKMASQDREVIKRWILAGAKDD
jgi:hypothetical protein